jgi:hypothetical protein
MELKVRKEAGEEAKAEHQDMAARIIDLERELRLQGDYFNKEINDHVNQHATIQKSSIVDEKKYMELLHKYSLMQQEYY